MNPTQFILPCMLVVMALSQEAKTQGTQEWVEARGEGTSRGASVADALAQAILKFYGGRLEGQNETSRTIREEITTESTDFESSMDSIKKLRQITKGFVRTYEVLESEELDDGLWESKIRAGMISFDPSDPRAGQRPTLAIAGFTWGGTAYGGTAMPLDKVLAALNGIATQSAGRSRIFTTLTRKYLHDADRELGALAGDQTATREAVKLGYRMGVDFLLEGSLEDFSIEVRNVTVGGITLPTEHAAARIKFEVVNVATGATRAFADVVAQWTQHDLNENAEFERRRLAASSPDALLLDMLAAELGTSLKKAYRSARWMEGAKDSAAGARGEATATGSLLEVLGRVERRLGAIEKRLEKIEREVGKKTPN